ncbi:hypothetical protein EK904_011133 [Melospiza melodia maxima]|nr:hypothetical protein EK904_011133 [Melospiza melodia maxima]
MGWLRCTDLENAYRFGQMEVSCEGYDYPDDPYILRGSCSLLFKLELTAEGARKAKNSGSFGSSYYQSSKDYSDSGSGAIVVIVLLVLAFGVYKFFLSNRQSQQSSGGSDGFSQPFWQSQQAPPPPGFKSTFTDDNSFGTYSYHGTSSGPGFWTGLGAGGLLGYLAGKRSRGPHITVCGQIPQLYLLCMGTQGIPQKAAAQEQELLLALGARSEDEILFIITSE